MTPAWLASPTSAARRSARQGSARSCAGRPTGRHRARRLPNVPQARISARTAGVAAVTVAVAEPRARQEAVDAARHPIRVGLQPDVPPGTRFIRYRTSAGPTPRRRIALVALRRVRGRQQPQTFTLVVAARGRRRMYLWRGRKALPPAPGRALTGQTECLGGRMKQRVPRRAWYSPGGAFGRPRVLVEDDHPALAISDFSRFQEAGFDVAFCSGPGHTPEDCPLLRGAECEVLASADAVLHGLDSKLGVAAAIRRRHPEIPVVAEQRRGEDGSLEPVPEGCVPLVYACSVKGQVDALRREIADRPSCPAGK